MSLGHLLTRPLFFLVDRRDDKVIVNLHTQSGGIGVQTPVMISGLTISTFLIVREHPIKLEVNLY